MQSKDPALLKIADRITRTVLTTWWRKEREDISVLASHLSTALTALACANTRYKRMGLLPWLYKRTNSRFANIRCSTIIMLGWMGPEIVTHPIAIRLLLARMNDKHRCVRQAAAEALGRIGATAPLYPDSFPTLLAALTHDEYGVRMSAAKGLVYATFSNDEMIQDLLTSLRDADERAALALAHAVRYDHNAAEVNIGLSITENRKAL